jgi:hypothetical protein
MYLQNKNLSKIPVLFFLIATVKGKEALLRSERVPLPEVIPAVVQKAPPSLCGENFSCRFSRSNQNFLHMVQGLPE